jgi:DHA2 family multidrug resistance protein-like MFS transporter
MYFDFTQYFQLVRGYSPVVAALYALPAGLAQLATANAARRLAVRNGVRVVLTAGLVASAGGLAMAVGSACILATAVVVAWKMPRSGPRQASSPDRSPAASVQRLR